MATLTFSQIFCNQIFYTLKYENVFMYIEIKAPIGSQSCWKIILAMFGLI